MEQAKFAYYLLEKPLEKQAKTIEDEGEQNQLNIIKKN